MQTDVLLAQLNEARAKLQQAISEQIKARAQITLRESDKVAAEAVVVEKESNLDATERRLTRSAKLSNTGAMPKQQFADDETGMFAARAALASARAQVPVAEAAIAAA